MKIRDNTIKLNQFLKLMGIVPTGGQAKLIIQGGGVLVNGTLETRRGKRLVPGDMVTVEGQTIEVNLNNDEVPNITTTFSE
jgi:ribosome-associated protein